MNIQTFLKQTAQSISSDNPQLDAELLLAERLDKSRSYLVAFADEVLSSSILSQLEKDVQQLEKGYPLAYLLGKKAFWDMELRVTEATLIPRADTETVIEVAQTLLPVSTTANIIDLGTGSGAIAIALSRIFTQSTITATDSSADALAVAQLNAESWQTAPITFKQASWLTGFGAGEFDLIVSNPPYIVEGDVHLDKLAYEPITALTAPNNGLSDLKTIITQSQFALNPRGWLLLEHGYDQGQLVRDLFDDTLWENVLTHRDLGGNERVTQGQLL